MDACYRAVVVAFFLVGSAFSQPPNADDVRRLHNRIDGLLRQELKDRWYPRSLDKQLGGFHQNFARDWSPIEDDNRFLVYQARMTWTAAAFAQYSPQDRAEFTRYADYGVDYLDRVMRDAQLGGFHWILEPDGKLSPRLGDEKHVYGTAFVLYAASKVFEVTANPRAKQVAHDAYQWLDRHAHDDEHEGYFEAIARDGKPLLSWEPAAPIYKRTDRVGVYYGFKSMNAHIHLLEAVTEYAKVEKDPMVKERHRELHRVNLERIAAEPGALNLYFTRDWRPAPAHDSFGHDVEAAYLLVESAEALGKPDDPATWRMARNLVDHALDWGWDDQHGGFYDKGDSFAARAYDTGKIWWVQAEGLNALLLMHRKYGRETNRYWSAFLKQWDFIEKHQIDEVHGGWYSECTREGKPNGDLRKANQWKANYHTARAMMNVAEGLRAMQPTGGNH
jgi:mannobiose 2-epimerase